MVEDAELIEEQEPETQDSGRQGIAGFWRRVFAFLLDAIVLGIIGFGLGMVLSDYFISLGPYGGFVGFAIALVYFGCLNSRLGGGQTLGKRACKIRVVNVHGESISLKTAVVRYLPLGLLLYLELALLPVVSEQRILSVAVGGIMLLLGVSTIYLLVFNRGTRQLPHDFLTKTYVIHAGSSEEFTVPSLRKAHIAICILLVIAMGITVGATFLLVDRFAHIDRLISFQKNLQDESRYHSVAINKGISFVNGTQSEYMNIAVAVYEKHEDYEVLCREIARTAIEQFDDLDEDSSLIIRVNQGYDIGIASFWSSHTSRNTVGEWIVSFQEL